MRASTRLNDIIGRFGGEEFIAIVPGGIEVAQKIAERVRTAFENAGAVIECQPIGATVSIGATASYDATMPIDALIAKADAALYRAKHDGRNRMVATERERFGTRPTHRRGATHPSVWHGGICAYSATQQIRAFGLIHKPYLRFPKLKRLVYMPAVPFRHVGTIDSRPGRS